MSEMATLKVSRTARDRLVAAAHTRGLTVRALLEDLSREVQNAALMDKVAAEMTRLRDSDPLGWEGYLEEGRAWEEATVERVDP